MSSLFDSINSWEFKPYRRMGVTIDEEMFYAKILARFVEGLSPRKVLDVGCGNCLFSLVLKKRFPHLEITSLDLWNDEISVTEIRGYLRDVDTNLVQNLFPLPFRDDQFDLVYAPLYFYNVVKSRRDELAMEIFRVLGKNSFLILVDLEIVRNLRKSFLKAGFVERNYYANQGVFFSLMQKT
ncbi:Methyltransferase type 11 [Metallosphaera sedula]|uniref:Methyltransferase type 11 n=3 Tax=Metallosphaera TaxID=41980 RepID=A4YF26_METS5|nr:MULTISPECIES: class I SAM-dependent methyltransferase [Metallosphaera]ABP95028.1 Methyltransferase type 11 [Metallosphaera sedula DSM 5348]AIM27014.1 Methyltransferase type 11 [Metallosphaera sedula]AKV73934.1 methyltransferase type 11 [Metallosphaera sedula]AKV76176.1 methyltransferase type 11 [Metallosphaera sedula]AKV78427.1 methyltransferase type 11 [Metallosphaera sedula]